MPDQGKEIPVFMYAPGQRLYHILVGVKNEKGALSDILGRLVKADILLYSITGSARPEVEVAKISFFAQSSGAALSASQVKAIVDDSKFAVECKVTGVDNGIIFEKGVFPLRISTGQRAIVVRSQLFSRMMKKAREMYGALGEAMIFEQGIIAGKDEWESLVKIVGRDAAVANSTEFASLYESLGWGRAEVLSMEVNPLKARFRIYDSAECEGQQSSKPYSQFMRGYITGGVELAYGVTCRVTEVACIAKGDPYCEFDISAEP